MSNLDEQLNKTCLLFSDYSHMFPASVPLACSNSEAVCKFIFLSIRVCRIWRRKLWQCRRQWVRPSTSHAIAWGSPKAWQLRWMSLAQLDVSVSWECEKMIWHSPLPLQLLGTSHFHPMHIYALSCIHHENLSQAVKHFDMGRCTTLYRSIPPPQIPQSSAREVFGDSQWRSYWF